MKILFITRNFPPQKGGMERVAFSLYSHFAQKINVVLIKWGGSRKLLFLILPYFLIAAIMALLTMKVEIIYIGDGLLSVFIPVLKVFKRPIVVTTYGLDITYKNRLYQLIISKCLSLADKIICISQYTKEECLKRGLTEDKIRIIPPGFKDEFYIADNREKLKKSFIKEFGFELRNKKILFTVSRLVERKGIHWFVDKVIPLLITEHRNFVYIVAGGGPMRSQIKNIIREKNLNNWVILLGMIGDESLRLIYNISDIFVMPNIPVASDIEGFGVVALESASCKVPVVASNLEGIKDVVIDGKNGLMVSPKQPLEFVKKIDSLFEDELGRRELGNRAREFVLSRFQWDNIADRYIDIFKEMLTN